MMRLEAMMKVVLNQLGIDPAQFEPPMAPEERAIRQALMEGDKLKAIKIYREHYGVDAKTAMDAIEGMINNARG